MSRGKNNKFFAKAAVLLVGGALSVFYLWLYVGVLHLELPKTFILRGINARWTSRWP